MGRPQLHQLGLGPNRTYMWFVSTQILIKSKYLCHRPHVYIDLFHCRRFELRKWLQSTVVNLLVGMYSDNWCLHFQHDSIIFSISVTQEICLKLLRWLSPIGPLKCVQLTHLNQTLKNYFQQKLWKSQTFLVAGFTIHRPCWWCSSVKSVISDPLVASFLVLYYSDILAILV